MRLFSNYRFLLICPLLFTCSYASASIIHINSQAGLSVFVPPGFSTTTVAVTPHPLWQPNHPTNPGDPADHSAVWIAHQSSGYGDSQFQPYMGSNPVAKIFFNFVSGAGNLILKVWADDTADVYLDGNPLVTGNFTQNICANGSLGCEPNEFVLLNVPLAAGSHTLQFNLYQVGITTDSFTNPTGILFTGTAPAHAPEPASLALSGLALVAGAHWLRRNRSF